MKDNNSHHTEGDQETHLNPKNRSRQQEKKPLTAVSQPNLDDPEVQRQMDKIKFSLGLSNLGKSLASSSVTAGGKLPIGSIASSNKSPNDSVPQIKINDLSNDQK